MVSMMIGDSRVQLIKRQDYISDCMRKEMNGKNLIRCQISKADS